MHTTILYPFCFTFRTQFNKLHEVFKLYYRVDFVFDGFAQLYTNENILNLFKAKLTYDAHQVRCIKCIFNLNNIFNSQ